MAECIKANGKKTKWKAKEFSHGLMDESILATIKMT
jgi:hypothetical protein